MKISLLQIIKSHQEVHLNLKIQDVYKLIYQSVFGVSHILKDSDKAKQFLIQEYDSIESSSKESLIENISISGKLVRLNLKPYKYHRGDIDQLFQAMVITAKNTHGAHEDFLDLWDQFKQAVFNDALNFDRQGLIDFDETVLIANYPVMHHSPEYREANEPAYRVVSGDLAGNLLKVQKIEF